MCRIQAHHPHNVTLLNKDVAMLVRQCNVALGQIPIIDLINHMLWVIVTISYITVMLCHGLPNNPDQSTYDMILQTCIPSGDAFGKILEKGIFGLCGSDDTKSRDFLPLPSVCSGGGEPSIDIINVI
jgi:hypothetical protein